ncbi:tetratricopeptide repeat protein [Archangium sp.]|uniref:tetratricopeptide repeat protein n=1 Tax=Archangium sp. TaxID=1872627 RepID=UPI00389A1B83
MTPRTLLLLVLFAPVAAWAELPGLQLYESGEYEAAVKSFEAVLREPRSTREEQGLARVYLAASLHALGQVGAVRQQLEALAREQPELRLDPARFLPELVALADAIRERVESEQRYAEAEAERERRAREEAALLRSLDKGLPSRLRPEALGIVDATGNVLMGTGVTYGRGPWEASARAWFSGAPVFHLQGGWLLGSGVFHPYLGLRGLIAPGRQGYGGGGVVGARYSLPAGFVAMLDVSAEYFIVNDGTHEPLAFTALAGLGFDVRLP